MNKNCKYWYNLAKTFMQNQPKRAIQCCDVAIGQAKNDQERKKIDELKAKIKEKTK